MTEFIESPGRDFAIYMKLLNKKRCHNKVMRKVNLYEWNSSKLEGTVKKNYAIKNLEETLPNNKLL